MDEQSRRVLILDSDPETLINLQRVFQDAEIDATITWDQTEAPQSLETLRYDIILIGHHPPELDAAAVLDGLSLHGICPSVLILRQTISEREVAEFQRLGAIGMVPASDSVAILEQVEKALAQKPLSKGANKEIRLEQVRSLPRAS